MAVKVVEERFGQAMELLPAAWPRSWWDDWDGWDGWDASGTPPIPC
jgi:hypothetical protein